MGIATHRAALPMARALLKQTDRPEVERLAQGTVASQRAEIRVMQEMLGDMGEEVPAEEPSRHTDPMPSMEHGSR